MSRLTRLLAALAVTLVAPMPAFAHDALTISDPYIRSAGATARSGAAFMVIVNHTDTDDRLIAASSDVAERVELHTHKAGADGMMQMAEIEGGIPVAAGESHSLQRGGDHMMFLGLTRPLDDGDMVSVTLTFEKAGDMIVEIPVDLKRMPEAEMPADMDHGHDTDG